MAAVRTHQTVWLTRAPGETALRRARPRRSMAVIRAFGMSAVAAGVLTLGVSSVPPAPAARADAASTTVQASRWKRLGRGAPRLTVRGAAARMRDGVALWRKTAFLQP